MHIQHCGNKKVSVVIPVYNTGENAVLLVSFLLENNDGIEVVLVDDGSSDDSLKILKGRFGENPRVKIYHQVNKGASAARNLGLSKASFELVVFIDSDDMVEQRFIEKLRNAVCDKALAITGLHYHRIKQGTDNDVYVNELRPRGEDESLENYMLWLLGADGRMYAVINKIFWADIIRDNGLRFDEKLDFAEDTKFVLEYLKCAEKKLGRAEIGFIDESLYIYNYGTETSTVGKSSLLWKNWLKSYRFLEKWAGDLDVKGKILIKKVLARWKISHMLAIARSGLTTKEKKKYLGGVGIALGNVLVKIRK